ncbi:MAG: hypothetical protein ABR920_13420 [Terriglobales bacterium]
MTAQDWNPLSYFREMGTLSKVLLLLGFVFLTAALAHGASFSDRMVSGSLVFVSLSLTMHYFSQSRPRLLEPPYNRFTDGEKMLAGAGMSVITVCLIIWFLLTPSPKARNMPTTPNDIPKTADVPRASDAQKKDPAPAAKKPADGNHSSGKNNTSGTRTQAAGDKSTAVGHVLQGPCSIVQAGGKDNQAATNCGPPPLVLTPSLTVVPSDQEGFIKTLIKVVPNVDVAPPVNVVLKFDNPVRSVGFWIEGAGGVMAGGPASVPSGTNPVIPLGTGFNSKHALLLTVYSASPVKLVDIHLE